MKSQTTDRMPAHVQAINATANGMPHAAAERVLDDAGINVSPNKPPFNLTAELEDLAAGNVPAAAAGVLGRINSNATQFLNGLVVVTVRMDASQTVLHTRGIGQGRA